VESRTNKAKRRSPAQRLEETLSALIRMPSVSDQPVTEVADRLAEEAEAVGMRVRRYETAPGKLNLVVSAGPEDSDGILLSGHMDVVPVAGQAWSSDPFRLTERQGRWYGRGTADMKGFLAATCVALGELNLSSLRRELVLVWTHDEEVGCHGSRVLVEKLLAESDRRWPRRAWIGEPTRFEMCRLHPGHSTFGLTCQGRPAHSSRPQLGASAIKGARLVLGALDAVEEAFRSHRGFDDDLPTPWTVLNIGTIHGGAAVNIVPERCEIRVGVRPLPGMSESEVQARIEEALAAIAAPLVALDVRVTLTLLQSVPALLSPADAGMISLLRPFATRAEPTGAPFATDGGNLARLGAEPIIFGPGDIDVAHRPDEFVEAADLLRAVEVIGAVVHKRCLDVA